MPMTTLRRSVPLLAGLLLAAAQPAGAQSTAETPLGTRTVSAADAQAGAQAVEPPLVLDGGNGGSGGFAVMPPSDYYRVAPVRVENGPQIDGRLDEEVWLRAAVIDEFVQQEPAEGEPATERTVVRLLYDAEALYLGVEAYDSEPDGVIATEMRRDSLRLLDEDNFQVILDTFQDRRSGYMFVTSPLGAKLEQQVAEEGEGGWRGRNSNNININWDGVWDVVSRRTADGWVAEIAIPMVTLRFPRHRGAGLGRQLHAQHPPQERAGVLGADLEGVHADPRQPRRYDDRHRRGQPRPGPAHDPLHAGGRPAGPRGGRRRPAAGSTARDSTTTVSTSSTAWRRASIWI